MTRALARAAGRTYSRALTARGERSMSGSLVRASTAVLACAVSVGAVGVAQAQPAPAGLDGFTPRHAALQRQYEARFQRGVSAGDIGRLSRRLSTRPHLVGTP